MPGIARDSGSWVFQRMELEPFGGQPHAVAPSEQCGAIRGDQMRHRSAEPGVVVHPKPSVHRVNHSVATLGKLPPPLKEGDGILGWRNPGKARLGTGGVRVSHERRPLSRHHSQVTSPSTVAGAGGEDTLPEKMAHVSGYDCGCVTLADHPVDVAVTMVTMTPGEVFTLSKVGESA